MNKNMYLIILSTFISITLFPMHYTNIKSPERMPNSARELVGWQNFSDLDIRLQQLEKLSEYSNKVECPLILIHLKDGLHVFQIVDGKFVDLGLHKK